MKLWERGLIGLDDPIENYIPEFKNVGILDKFFPKDSTFTIKPTKNKITVRNLLTYNQLVPGSSPGGTTSKIKPLRKVRAFFIYKSHKKVISTLFLIRRLMPSKPSKSSKNVR